MLEEKPRRNFRGFYVDTKKYYFFTLTGNHLPLIVYNLPGNNIVSIHTENRRNFRTCRETGWKLAGAFKISSFLQNE
jgi:hypothetical protein